MGQMERWISHIMRDNSRDGIMVEFWDSTKEEKAKDGDPAVVKFNEGQLFRELLIPTPQCPGKWPIPEGYSPKERAERSKSKGHHHGESKHDLPARPCRPQLSHLLITILTNYKFAILSVILSLIGNPLFFMFIKMTI